ncbi:MAG: PAS domain S-box protein [Thermoplasmatota archaeon]
MRLKVLLILMCLTVSMIPIVIIGGFEGFETATAFLSLIFFITLIVSIIMTHCISRPLEKLTKHINEISKGNLEVKLDKSDIYEINNLTESLNRVMTSLKLAIQKVGVKKGELSEETIKSKEEVEEKFKDILKLIDGFYWETDSRGVILNCSAKISNILGYNTEEIIGTSLFKLTPCEESTKLGMALKNAKKHKKIIHNHKHIFYHKNGQRIILDTNVFPLFDKEGCLQGYRGINTELKDFTESNTKKQSLLQKNQKVKKTVYTKTSSSQQHQLAQPTVGEINNQISIKNTEQNFDYFFLLDEKAKIVDCSDDIDKKIGYTKNEIIYRHLSCIDVIDDKKTVEKLINNARKQGPAYIKSMHKQKNGSKSLVTEEITYLKNQNLFRVAVSIDLC